MSVVYYRNPIDVESYQLKLIKAKATKTLASLSGTVRIR